MKEMIKDCHQSVFWMKSSSVKSLSVSVSLSFATLESKLSQTRITSFVNSFFKKQFGIGIFIYEMRFNYFHDISKWIWACLLVKKSMKFFSSRPRRPWYTGADGKWVTHFYATIINKGHLTPILSVPSRHIGPSQSFCTPLDWLLRSAPPPTTSNLPLVFLSLLYVSKWSWKLKTLFILEGLELIRLLA